MLINNFENEHDPQDQEMAGQAGNQNGFSQRNMLPINVTDLQNNRTSTIDYGETQQNLIRHQMLNPHLYKRGPTKYQKQQTTTGNNAKVKGHWTEGEDMKLTEAVRINGGKNWKKIAESLKGRTDVQCLHRW